VQLATLELSYPGIERCTWLGGAASYSGLGSYPGIKSRRAPPRLHLALGPLVVTPEGLIRRS
jgi:hypothetical protein